MMKVTIIAVIAFLLGVLTNDIFSGLNQIKSQMDTSAYIAGAINSNKNNISSIDDRHISEFIHDSFDTPSNQHWMYSFNADFGFIDIYQIIDKAYARGAASNLGS